MTALTDLLIARIARDGPMTLADYMTACLLHPEHGYYTTRDPLGAAGDFITAPEISQMFGEVLGLALAQSWLDQGAQPFVLAEIGPGRGTLMADVLRATRVVPGFHAAAEVVLIEASPVLRARQAVALAGHPARWLTRAEDLPEAPLFLLANEFFDALPIRQFTRTPQGWAETVVAVVAGRLVLGQGAALPAATLAHRLDDTRPGDVVEVCPAAAPVMATIGARVARNGGLALIFDYGGWQGRGDTFQALRAHRFADPLESPGAADLTAHVDFADLALAAAPARTAYATQGAVLRALGLHLRAERLALSLKGDALAAHHAATRRLTAPEEMGELFKALAVFAPTGTPPPGFG